MGMEEGWRAFARVLKYFRHILMGFCKDSEVKEGRRALARVLK